MLDTNDVPPDLRKYAPTQVGRSGSVVVTSLQDHEILAVDEVDQPVLVGDAPRPRALYPVLAELHHVPTRRAICLSPRGQVYAHVGMQIPPTTNAVRRS